MKYKIQTLAVHDQWADLKSSDGHSPYTPELYDSVAEALEEINTLVEELQDEVHENYRVVLEDVPEEFDLY
jgi:hypothetical protein